MNGTNSELNNEKMFRKVVIIGGGFAGMAAGQRLASQGFKDFLILEARKRLGGRVLTLLKDKGPLEMGAQWIHGENGNILFEVAKENKLILDMNKYSQMSWFNDENEKEEMEKVEDEEKEDDEEVSTHPGFCLSDGSRVPNDLIEKTFSKFDSLLDEAESYFKNERLSLNFQVMMRPIFEKIQNELKNEVKSEEYSKFQSKSKKIIQTDEKENISVGKFLEKHFQKYFEEDEGPEGDPLTLEVKKGLFNWRLMTENTENACTSMDEIPLSVWGEYKICEGEEGVELGPKGYQAVIDYFIKEIQGHAPLRSEEGFDLYHSSKEEPEEEDGVHIKLQSEVTNIRWSGICGCHGCNKDIDINNSNDKNEEKNEKNNLNFVPSENNALNNNVTLTLSNGKIITTDHVIITIPLGVLKQKCGFLNFPSNHSQKTLSPSSSSSSSSSSSFSSPTPFFTPQLPNCKLKSIEGLGFGTVNKIFLEFEKPFWSPSNKLGFMMVWREKDEDLQLQCLQEKGRSIKDAKWVAGVQGFLTLIQHSNFLCGWIAGEKAEEMESETDDLVTDVCWELLVKFSGISPQKIPKPKRMVRSKWRSDPYSRGSYSYRTFSSSFIDSHTLSVPLPSINKPELLFAGEATHNYFYSTTHGAVATGYKQADDLLQYFDKK